MLRRWCIVVGTIATVHVARADTAAETLFAEGRALLTDHHVAAACAKFSASIKLDPDAAGTMLNLGLCNELLDKYGTALRWFRKAQARASETKNPDYETAAKSHTLALADKVATIHIVVTPAAIAELEIRIDGETVSPEDLARVELDTGHHIVVARAPHHKTRRAELEIADRGTATVTLALDPGEDEMIVDPGRGRRRAATYVAIAGGALAFASVALAAYERFGPYARAKQRFDAGDPDAASDAASATHVVHVYGTGLFVAGTAAVAVACYLYFFAPREQITRTAIGPELAPHQAVLAFTRRF